MPDQRSPMPGEVVEEPKHHPALIVLALLILVGLIWYFGFSNKYAGDGAARTYSAEERHAILESLRSDEPSIPKEEREAIIAELQTASTQTYSQEERRAILDSLK